MKEDWKRRTRYLESGGTEKVTGVLGFCAEEEQECVCFRKNTTVNEFVAAV